MPFPKPSALGYTLLVMQQCTGTGWQVACFSKSGRYRGGPINLPTRQAAAKHRRKLMRHHESLARERATRRRTKA
jgi:hypothetical protein